MGFDMMGFWRCMISIGGEYYNYNRCEKIAKYKNPCYIINVAGDKF